MYEFSPCECDIAQNAATRKLITGSTQNNKESWPKTDTTTRKFYFYGKTVTFTSYRSYGFRRRDVNKANATAFMFVTVREVLSFSASTTAILSLFLHGTDTLRLKILRNKIKGSFHSCGFLCLTFQESLAVFSRKSDG